MKFTAVLLMVYILISDVDASLKDCYKSGYKFTLRQILKSFAKDEQRVAYRLTAIVDTAQPNSNIVTKAYDECKKLLTDQYVNKEFAFCYVRALKFVCWEMRDVIKLSEFIDKVGETELT